MEVNEALKEPLNEVYDKLKLNFYRNIFTRFENRDSTLTTAETICTEVIYALDRPTINEVAKFLGISQPNITYKINNLVKKGYVNKIQSLEDKREFYLELTAKFYDYYDIKNKYMDIVLKRAEKRFTNEEIEEFVRMLKIISNELMPEITNVATIKAT